MDSKLILAVAGSGKTRHLIESLNLEKRSLIVTYTINNTENLRKRVIQKFGFLPTNIRIHTYFSFLYQFCFQPLYQDAYQAKGISFNNAPFKDWRKKSDVTHYFIPKLRILYANRLAKFFLEFDPDGLNSVKQRLERYFDNLFVDEFQDFASYDFDFICELSKSNVSSQFVGDYHQHTFDTSRDGQFKKNLHQSEDRFLIEVKKHGITVDATTLIKSYRCSPSVATFVRESLGIEMGSQRTDETNILFIEDQKIATDLVRDDEVIKLLYQNSRKMDFHALNWGASKGLDDFDDVCIIVNDKLFRQIQDQKSQEINGKTLKKLYVACTRAKRDIFFVRDKFVK